MPTDNLIWRVENICRKAWPALQQTQCGDWILGFSDGLTRRANSANPLSVKVTLTEPVIDACQREYRLRHQPTIFRVPSIIDPNIDVKLAQSAYIAEGESCVLYADLNTSTEDEDVELTTEASPQWLDAMTRLQGHTALKAEISRKIISTISPRTIFATLHASEQIAALAYGVILDELICFESVITDVQFRGLGYGRRLCKTLLARAKSMGAKAACLQVEASNSAARSLYSDLGFKAELYRYHYRREPS